ncbi:MAG: hypothetical protein QOH82_3877, partial [Mycobacterium sp.]|nr:hypothetical protein [Mycobacterium sp.]
MTVDRSSLRFRLTAGIAAAFAVSTLAVA